MTFATLLLLILVSAAAYAALGLGEMVAAHNGNVTNDPELQRELDRYHASK